jgi:cation:H+ antiporter
MVDGAVFLLAAGVSLSTSWLLVSRIERIGRSLGVSEAMLGLLAALTADAPEITSAVNALINHQHQIGVGVILGSNVFNLAALLGVGALVTGHVAMHRNVVVLTGVIAIWCGAMTLISVIGAIPVTAGLALVLAALVPYVLLAAFHGRVPTAVPCWGGLRKWLLRAVRTEEREVHETIEMRAAGRRDVVVALASLVVVVLASSAMEHSASSLGTKWAIPGIIVGGIVLAAVTSLPNAVAGVYLARRGRGAATLSTAFNSNALNISVGLLIPAAFVGLGGRTGEVTLVAAWYLAMSVLVVFLTKSAAGLSRRGGLLVVAAYLAFVVAVSVTG